MSVVASRAVFRQSTLIRQSIARRFESSKATDKASEFKSKASEGLSKVTSSGGAALSGAASSVGNTLSKIGGRTGRLISFVQRQIPPTIYYARVGLELSKLVFQGQKMTPPPVSTFQAYFQRALKGVRNPQSLFSSGGKSGATPEAVISRVRNLNATQLAAGGVIFAEAVGFFTIGEMIGRFKIIGYRGDTSEAHGH